MKVAAHRYHVGLKTRSFIGWAQNGRQKMTQKSGNFAVQGDKITMIFEWYGECTEYGWCSQGPILGEAYGWVNLVPTS